MFNDTRPGRSEDNVGRVCCKHVSNVSNPRVSRCQENMFINNLARILSLEMNEILNK